MFSLSDLLTILDILTENYTSISRLNLVYLIYDMCVLRSLHRKIAFELWFGNEHFICCTFLYPVVLENIYHLASLIVENNYFLFLVGVLPCGVLYPLTLT